MIESAEPTTDGFLGSLDEGPRAEDRLAVRACLDAKADLFGEERLRRVREAGRRLLAVRRTPGARTSLSGITRWQAVLAEAGITRPTAIRWQRAAEVDDDDVAAYLAAAGRAEQEITVAGLLRWAKKDPPGPPTGSDGDAVGDADAPSHVCPSCGSLVPCDRGGAA